MEQTMFRCEDRKCKGYGKELVKSTIKERLVCPASIYVFKEVKQL